MGGSLDRHIAEIVRNDHRFESEAYLFIFEALDFTVRMKYGSRADDPEEARGQHVTGHDLLAGIREYALETFGCLTATVFSSWGVHGTDDFGEMVFNLVEHGLMGRQETDSKSDFANGYEGRTFEEVFQVRPVFDYCPEKDEWKASYESVVSG